MIIVETIVATQIYLLLAALGVGLTLIALVGRGLYVWGRLSRQVDSHTEQLTDLGGRMNNVENRLGNVETRLAVVETRLDAVDAKIDALDAKIDALDAKIDARFAAQDAKIEARFAAQDAKIDVLISEVRRLSQLMVAMAPTTATTPTATSSSPCRRTDPVAAGR